MASALAPSLFPPVGGSLPPNAFGQPPRLPSLPPKPLPPPPRLPVFQEADKKVKARGRGLLYLAAGLIPLILPPLAFGCDRGANYGRMLRGVWIDDVALSGLDREAARVALQTHFGKLTTKPVQVKVGGQTFAADPTVLGFRVDLERTLNAAQAEGRFGSVWNQFRWWLERWAASASVQVEGTLDSEKLAGMAVEWERKGIPDAPFSGSVFVKGDSVEVEYPRIGRGIDQPVAASLIARAFAEGHQEVVELPLYPVKPSLDRVVVENAARRARQALSGPVDLVSADGTAHLRLDRSELLKLFRTREITKPRGAGLALAVEFDPEAVGALPKVKALARPAKDARFDVNAHEELAIIPDEPGVRVDPESLAQAAFKAAMSPGRAGLFALDRSEGAKRDWAESRSLGIHKLVAEFTTFHPCCKPRVQNIHRIADLLDGTVVRSGETFSANAAVGPRTRKNGFVPAPTIEDGEMVDSLGGGISQFATTLFNAVFLGGYEIVERQPHSYYFSRYPMGHEATLSYPKPDLVFKNDTAAGMLIRCVYGEKFIRVKVYGDNGGRKVEVKVSDRFEIKRPATELLPNRKLAADDEQIKEGGSLGWSVTVFRNLLFKDGTKREEKRKVTYHPRIRRVEVHPCRIPRGEPGWTGEQCPVPEEPEAKHEPPIPQGISPDSPLDEGF